MRKILAFLLAACLLVSAAPALALNNNDAALADNWYEIFVYSFADGNGDRIGDFVGLKEKLRETAGYLSYGDQRRLEIAITLACDPILLMLDEPTSGVARKEGYGLMDLAVKLAKERGMTVMFIEHDMDIIFNYSQNISVLDHGTLLATGTPQEIRENEAVQRSYLGGAV